MSYTLNRIKSNRKIQLRKLVKCLATWGELCKSQSETTAQIEKKMNSLIKQAQEIVSSRSTH